LYKPKYYKISIYPTTQWYYTIKKKNDKHIENQNVLTNKRLIAIDLGILVPGTGYSPNGHTLSLNINQPTSDIADQIEKLTSLDTLTQTQKTTLLHLKRRYKYRNDIGGELYGYLLAQDRLKCKISKTKEKDVLESFL